MGGSGEKGDSQESIQEALDMSSFLYRLQSIDLGKLEAEIAKQSLAQEKALTAQERMLRDLRANKKISRYLKSRTPRRKKLHWTQKRRNRLNYLRAVAYPKRAAQLADSLETGEGWYKYLCTGWRKKRARIEMTEREWVDEVWPTLEGRLPVIVRYDSKGPISLGNIYVLDSETRAVLFEGTEWRLRKDGYIL